MKLLSIIRKIDIFGRSVELRLDKHKKHKTICGAFMTLFIFFITVVVIFIYVGQFAKYDNPFLRIYDLRQEDILDINDPKDEYGLELKVQLNNQSTNEIIQEDSLVLVANLMKSTIINKSGQVISSTQLKKCIDNDQLYCLPRGSQIKLTPFSEEGFDYELNQYLQINVIDCNQYVKQSGQKVQCKSSSEIEQIIKTAKIDIYFNQYEVNPKEYNDPISKTQRIHSQLIIKTNNASDQIEEIQILFQQIILSTDTGWFLDDYQNQHLLSYHSYRELKSIQTDNIIFKANLLIHSQSHNIERNYSKIQVYLAYIGGIIKMLMLIGEFITRPFVRLSLSIKIVNEVFDFEGGESIEGSADLMSIEELMNDTRQIPIENQIPSIPIKYDRGFSITSLNKYRSSSPTALDLMQLSITKERLSINKLPYDQNEPNPLPGNLIKMQKTDNSHKDMTDFSKRNRNISIIQEHQYDGHSISTLQNQRKSREGTSPISMLGHKKQSNNGSSKHSKNSLEMNNLHQIQEIPYNFTINTEEASPIQKIQRKNEIKQTFQPINMTSSNDKFNQSNSIIIKQTLSNISPNLKSSHPSSPSITSSSSSSSSSSSNSSQCPSNRLHEQQANKQSTISNSLPASPTKNEMKTGKQYYPYKSQRDNKQNIQKPNNNYLYDSQLSINTKSRYSQKITGEIEEMIHTPNCQKFISPQLIQNSQKISYNQNNQQSKPAVANFLTIDQNSPLQRRNKSILKNGNPHIIRHSYSAGDGFFDMQPLPSEAQTPKKKLHIQDIFSQYNDKQLNSEDKSVNFNGQKSESSIRQSPQQMNRYSLISSPERDQSFSPTHKCPNIKNLCFDTQSSNRNNNPNEILERRSHSVLATNMMRSFKQPENIFTRLGQHNIFPNQNGREIRTRNSSQQKSQIPRQSTKRFSTIDQQKILAASRLMQNYSNHQETPLQALKDYGKLAQSPKKVRNVESIFKKLFNQGKVLRMKFFDYITFYLQFFRKIYSEKKKQIKYSKQKVKERLDVVYIMQKLVEIDKLKILLLSDDQIKLFEFLPKPIVHLNPNDAPQSPQLKDKSKTILNQQQPQNMQQAWSMLHQQKKPIEKAIEASKVYRSIIDSDPKYLTSIDLKLIDMIDIRIKNIFENQIQNQRQDIVQCQSETNNSIIILQKQYNNIHQNNITPFENNITRDNVNETQLGFLETQQQFKNNMSTVIDKGFNQDRKSLDDMNNSKLEIQTSLNHFKLNNNDNSKILPSNEDKQKHNHNNNKNQFFFEIEIQNQKKLSSDNIGDKKRQNSINIIDPQQKIQMQNSIDQQIYLQNGNIPKKTEWIY